MSAPRCSDCKLHVPLCICEMLPRINTDLRLLLVIHRRELDRPSNTGMFAVKCLAQGEAWVRGAMGTEALDFTKLADDGFTNLLLYPNEDAMVLTPELVAGLKKPVRLIVPDGNWGQASRTASRIRSSLNPQTVIIPPGKRTEYRLRKEMHKDGLATFEAIARVMGLFEGEKVQQELEHFFRILVERSLYMRGRLGKEEVYGGIP